MTRRIKFYTDGAITGGNPGGTGGWGCIGLDEAEAEIVRLLGHERNSTNNRMELTAVIEALSWCWEHAPGCRLLIVSDSQYVVKGASEYLEGWKRRRWINAQKKPVINRDLWERLDWLKGGAQFQWVRGHDGNHYNEIADQLAVEAAARGHGS